MVDKLVLMHGLETSEHGSALLDECFRTLGPGGRAVFIVPNRAGIWSRSDRTPFGYGRPYSLSQLEAQLRRHGFAVERALSTLYQPPSTRKIWRKSAAFLESVGRHLPVFAAGGVLFVEASKQVALPSKGHRVTAREPVRVMDALPSPALVVFRSTCDATSGAPGCASRCRAAASGRARHSDAGLPMSRNAAQTAIPRPRR
jgi:hypothetical protein